MRLSNGTSRERWLLWAAICALPIAVVIFPVGSRLTRIGSIGVLGGAVALLLIRTWRFRTLRWLQLASWAVIVALVCGPGRNLDDPESLRMRFLQRLRAYEGVRYYWGGENALGIDCSGLVRRAMIEALLSQGVSTWNPGLIRESLRMWWNDSSALAFKDNRKLTVRIDQVQSVNSIDPSRLQPGDLVSNGTHIMAYLGEQHWIEADPGLQRVLVLKAPTDNGWFQCPMTILRWQYFYEQ